MVVVDADGRAVGRLTVHIPLGSLGTKARLRALIDDRLLQGEAGRAVAKELKVSERAVFRARARLVAAGKLRRGLSGQRVRPGPAKPEPTP